MIALAPIHANVDGVVDNLGTVAGAIESPPPRYVAPSPAIDPIRFPIDAGIVRPPVQSIPSSLRPPSTAPLDPILNPPPIAPGSPTGRVPGVPTVPSARPYDPSYQSPPSVGYPNSGGPSIGFGYTPPANNNNGSVTNGQPWNAPGAGLQSPTSTSDTGATTLPTVTVIANELRSNWKLVAGLGLVIVLLVAFLRFRR